MIEKIIFLAIIMVLGYLSKSQTIMIASVFLIAAVLLQVNDTTLETIRRYSIKYGIILITIFAFVPIAKGDITFFALFRALLNWRAWIAIGAGILVTQFAKNGINLMKTSPDITTFVLVGIVVGILVPQLKGYPSGPLIGTGIAMMLYGVVEYIIKVMQYIGNSF
ncbi:DUF441 domain-containing protein [Haloplasma contractile]|nr:DUF441 family protein [Haloplasma contractile]